jgi:hypothetical protein
MSTRAIEWIKTHWSAILWTVIALVVAVAGVITYWSHPKPPEPITTIPETVIESAKDEGRAESLEGLASDAGANASEHERKADKTKERIQKIDSTPAPRGSTELARQLTEWGL